MRRLLPLLAFAALLAALAVPAGAARTRTVTLRDISFRPHTITIRKGTVVRWVDKDAVRHNVRATRGPRRFHSRAFGHNRAYTHRFDVRGRYTIVCTIHPGMSSIVKVR